MSQTILAAAHNISIRFPLIMMMECSLWGSRLGAEEPHALQIPNLQIKTATEWYEETYRMIPHTTLGMHIYNTMTGKQEEFDFKDPGLTGWISVGKTLYEPELIYSESDRSRDLPFNGDFREGHFGTGFGPLKVGFRFPIQRTIVRVVEFNEKGVLVVPEENSEFANRLGPENAWLTSNTLRIVPEQIEFQSFDPANGYYHFRMRRHYRFVKRERPWRQLDKTVTINFQVKLGEELVIPEDLVLVIPERRFRLVDVVPRDEEMKVAGWFVWEPTEPGKPIAPELIRQPEAELFEDTHQFKSVAPLVQPKKSPEISEETCRKTALGVVAVGLSGGLVWWRSRSHTSSVNTRIKSKQ